MGVRVWVFCYCCCFPNQRLQGKQVAFRGQTLVSRQIPICFLSMWVWSILDLFQQALGSAALLSRAVLMSKMCRFTKETHAFNEEPLCAGLPESDWEDDALY